MIDRYIKEQVKQTMRRCSRDERRIGLTILPSCAWLYFPSREGSLSLAKLASNDQLNTPIIIDDDDDDPDDEEEEEEED